MNTLGPNGPAAGVQRAESAPRPVPQRSRRIALWAAAVTVSLGVFALYLRPDLALTLANQLWNCF